MDQAFDPVVLEGLDEAFATPQQPTPDEFLDYGRQLLSELDQAATQELVLQAADVLNRLNGFLQDRRLGHLIIRAAQHPHGLVAQLVRHRLQQRLPAWLNSEAAADVVVQLLAGIFQRLGE